MKDVNLTKLFPGADVFLLQKDSTYYLYCTTENSSPAFESGDNSFETAIDGEDGIQVRTSDDLMNWSKPTFCLKEEQVLGTECFWAPEVYLYKGKYYMIYTANTHIAIAVADDPSGPFLPHSDSWLVEDYSIDGHLLFDDDGEIYLYYADVTCGNRIRVAKMCRDLKKVCERYPQILIKATEDWETVDCDVTEGPFVLKHKGLYYLTYSANHTRSPDYAVGYAVSKFPTGPFEKYKGNPILHKPNGVVGTGHHSFAPQKDENRFFLSYHCHGGTISGFKPRMACITEAAFVPQADGIDILTVLHK